MARFILPKFSISDVDWRALFVCEDMYSCEASIKLTLTFDKLPVAEDDSTFDFTLIALDSEGFGVFELDFYSYTLPKSKKIMPITKQFDCPHRIFQLIDEWIIK